MTETTNNSDELGTKMCQYFVDFHKSIRELEDGMDKTFSEFKKQIDQLGGDERKKYEKHIDIMHTMADHGGERDWPHQTMLGEEYGSHMLGLHEKEDPDCIYCQDTRHHNQGLHVKNNPDIKFCLHCKEVNEN